MGSVRNRVFPIAAVCVERGPGGYDIETDKYDIETSFPHQDQEVESLPIWCQSINVSDTL